MSKEADVEAMIKTVIHVSRFASSLVFFWWGGCYPCLILMLLL